MAHSQKTLSDRPDRAHVETIPDDRNIPQTAEYHPEELVKSKFDDLSIPRTVWVFRRVSLVALAIYTGYVCEGFEVSDWRAVRDQGSHVYRRAAQNR
jgi:SP family general alpha glucoside:H+ symporter-like MFS transporter